MNRHRFAYLLVFLIIAQPFAVKSAEFKVVFLNPGHPDQNATGKFWPNVSSFMNAAANDLNIKLVTINAHRNHIVMKSMVAEVVAEKPDYVVLVNEKGAALEIVKKLVSIKIPVFMLLNRLGKKELSQLTRQQKEFIVGSVVPDNYDAGKKLIFELVKRYRASHRLVNSEKLISVLALQGDYNTFASIERKRGFTDGIEELGDVLVVDSPVANWSKQQAYQKTKGIIKRHKLNIIWAANDAMAFGAKQASLEVKLNQPTLVGGVNWDVDDPHFPVDVSFGGHVVLGALSLIMIRDIAFNLMPDTERHNVENIFVSSSTELFPLFTLRLKQKQLESYDFSQFGYASAEKRKFSIENLSLTFENEPVQ